MSIDFIDYLKETFENVETLNREKVRGLYRESQLFFISLGEMIRSGAKEKAFQLVLEIKQFLDAKASQWAALSTSTLSEEEDLLAEEMREALDDVVKEKKAKKHKQIKLKNMS